MTKFCPRTSRIAFYSDDVKNSNDEEANDLHRKDDREFQIFVRIGKYPIPTHRTLRMCIQNKFGKKPQGGSEPWSSGLHVHPTEMQAGKRLHQVVCRACPMLSSNRMFKPTDRYAAAALRYQKRDALAAIEYAHRLRGKPCDPGSP